MYPPLCGAELECQSYPTPQRGAAISKRCRQNHRDSGGVGTPIIPYPPTGRHYPANGPSRCGGTRV